MSLLAYASTSIIATVQLSAPAVPPLPLPCQERPPAWSLATCDPFSVSRIGYISSHNTARCYVNSQISAMITAKHSRNSSILSARPFI
jgi:hypothetical protein